MNALKVLAVVEDRGDASSVDTGTHHHVNVHKRYSTNDFMWRDQNELITEKRTELLIYAVDFGRKLTQNNQMEPVRLRISTRLHLESNILNPT